MPARWMYHVLGCPVCAGALTPAREVVRCRRCGPYPVLGGVVVLVPDPAAWCAEFYDAALAALAERGLAAPGSVRALGVFAGGAGGGEARRFGDDWTAHEARGGRAPAPAGDGLEVLLRAAPPAAWLAARARGVVVEVGCGAGALTRRLERVVAGDLSLRAVLAAGGAAVMDGEALPVQDGAADTIVAENVVDLLVDREAFFARARRALAPGGRLLTSAPAELGTPRGFVVEERVAAAPWVRAHSPRHYEVYFVELTAFRRR